MSKLKCVWIARVRHMSATNDVFIPTFDLPSMSVAALERAATAPQRFFRLIKASGGGSKLYPVRRGMLSLAQDGNAVPGFDSFRQIRLVPGGRFLLARTKTEFQIWDLEMPAGCSNVLYSASLEDLLDVPEAALTHINMEDCYRGSEETSLRVVFTQCCDRDRLVLNCYDLWGLAECDLQLTVLAIPADTGRLRSTRGVTLFHPLRLPLLTHRTGND